MLFDLLWCAQFVFFPFLLKQKNGYTAKLPELASHWLPFVLRPYPSHRKARLMATTSETHAARQAHIERTHHPLAFTLSQPAKSVLCTFKMSILPKVLSRAEIYLFVLLHILFFVLKAYGYAIFEVDSTRAEWSVVLKFTAISIPSGLMSLLLVFFNGQCFSRYCSLYDHCMGMHGTVQEFAQLSAVHAIADPAKRWDATRYLLASVMILYMKVTDIARNKRPSVDPEDWERLLLSEHEWLEGPSYAPSAAAKADMLASTPRPAGGPPATLMQMPPILLPEEVRILKRCRGRESQVLQIWSLEVMWKAYSQSGAENHFRLVEQVVLECRKHTGAIPNILNNPIPFPYYHLMVCLMWSNYVLYSVTFLELDSLLTPVAMFLIVATTTGVRELSSALANPFGDDEVDFNSSSFIHGIRDLATFLTHPDFNIKWQHPDTQHPPANVHTGAQSGNAHLFPQPAHYVPPVSYPPLEMVSTHTGDVRMEVYTQLPSLPGLPEPSHLPELPPLPELPAELPAGLPGNTSQTPEAYHWEVEQTLAEQNAQIEYLRRLITNYVPANESSQQLASPPTLGQFGAASSSPEILEAMAGHTRADPAQPSHEALQPRDGTSLGANPAAPDTLCGPPRTRAALSNVKAGANCGSSSAGSKGPSFSAVPASKVAALAPVNRPLPCMKSADTQSKPTAAGDGRGPPKPTVASEQRPATAPLMTKGTAQNVEKAAPRLTKPRTADTLEEAEGGKVRWRPAPPVPKQPSGGNKPSTVRPA